MDKEIGIVNNLVREIHSTDISENDLYIDGLDMNIFEPKTIISITHETHYGETFVSTTEVINISKLTANQKKEKLTQAINLFIRENVAGMENFDYASDKESAEKQIILKWSGILANLMNICGVLTRAKIKPNKWKPTFSKMASEAKCISKVKWQEKKTIV